jgi:hypothetical protein
MLYCLLLYIIISTSIESNIEIDVQCDTNPAFCIKCNRIRLHIYDIAGYVAIYAILHISFFLI